MWVEEMSLLTFIKPCAIFLSIRMEIKDTSRRNMENIVRDNENPCVRNWKELGQRACLQKRAEEREAAAGRAVFEKEQMCFSSWLIEVVVMNTFIQRKK